MTILLLLGYLWSLPNTLVGVLLAAVYWPRKASLYRGALVLVVRNRMFGHEKPRPEWDYGQTWGWLIFVDDEHAARNPALLAHERRHVLQGMVGGPLFLVAYAVDFLVLWGIRGFRPSRWREAYRRVWFERDAEKAAANV